MTRRNAPSHLSTPSAAWWRKVVSDYSLDEHHEKLLTLACEALDRGQEARERLQEDGSFFTGRHGSCRPHPAPAVARDASITFSRVLRELHLAGEPGPHPRPPRRP